MVPHPICKDSLASSSSSPVGFLTPFGALYNSSMARKWATGRAMATARADLFAEPACGGHAYRNSAAFQFAENSERPPPQASMR